MIFSFFSSRIERFHGPYVNAKLIREAKESGLPPDQHSNHISIVDVISSMHLRLPLNEENVLTDELIMKTLAAHWQIPFTRLDPLKLKLEVVTSKISEPFAKRHLIVPIAVDEAQELLKTLHKKFDKAAKRHIIQKNTAARRKSRYTLLLKKSA